MKIQVLFHALEALNAAHSADLEGRRLTSGEFLLVMRAKGELKGVLDALNVDVEVEK